MSFVADVLADLMNKKSLKDVAVIGHSMGGYIGQMCIKKYPEIFTSLIHFNSNPFADGFIIKIITIKTKSNMNLFLGSKR